MVTNDVPELAHNVNDAQRINHNDAKKKYCKVAFCIKSAMDVVNFDQISHVEYANESWYILVEYYEGGEKVKGFNL